MANAENLKLDADVTVAVHAKPGIKTTEFWKSVIVHVVAMMIIAWGMAKGSDSITAVGSVLLGLANGSYTLSRGMAKKGLAAIVDKEVT